MNSSNYLPLRGRDRRVVGTLAAATALVALVSGDPASAADETPAPGEALSMTFADDGIVSSGSVEVRFDLPEDREGGEDIVVTRGQALASGDDVRAWLDGSAGSATKVVDTLDADGDAVTATLSFDRVREGIYPVKASWNGEEQRGVVYVPGERAKLALIVPVTAPAIEGGIVTSDELAELTAEDGSLTAILDAVDGTPAILAVDPAAPAAIRALGAKAPASAVAWLERLVGLENDRFALQYGDADVSSQVDAGRDSLIAPTHLGNFVDESVEGATLSSLLDIGEAASSQVLWPIPGSADDETVDALVGDGALAGDDARVLVPASTTTDGVPTIGDDVIAYDDDTAEALLGAARETDPQEHERESAAVRADLWLATTKADEPLVVAFDRGETDGLADALDDAVAFAGGETAGLDDALAAGRGSVDLVDAPADAERAEAINAYFDDYDGLATIAKALASPSAFLGETRAELQQLLSVAWAEDPDAWQARAESLAALNDDRQTAIEVQQQQPVQLLSGTAPMPVWIRNDLPYPAEVTIVAVPDDPRLVLVQRNVTTAQADSVTRATIDVRSRVGSGEVTVHYLLETADGTRIGPARDVEVTVRASWERTGLVGLGMLVAGLLAVGGVRQARRRRRAKRADSDN